MDLTLAAAVGLAAALCSTSLHAQSEATCVAPRFEPANLPAADPSRSSAPIVVGNLLTLLVPLGFEQMVLSHGGGGFRYADGRRLTLSVDVPASSHRFEPGSAPGALEREVFTGASPRGCKYLGAMRLDEYAYRVRVMRGPLEVFAYGGDAEHHFVAVHADKPEVAVRGLWRGATRHDLEVLLATLQPR